jgi:hypothetical protein
MPRAGFEPTTSATNRPQTYASDRAVNGIGYIYIYIYIYIHIYAYEGVEIVGYVLIIIAKWWCG